jgi:hypothetical protein
LKEAMKKMEKKIEKKDVKQDKKMMGNKVMKKERGDKY